METKINKKCTPFLKSGTKSLIFCIVLALFSFLFLTSCRSVKKDKTQVTEIFKTDEIKKEIKTSKEELNTKETFEIKTNNTTGTTTKKTTTRPIDPTKPAIKTDKNGNKTILENVETVEEEAIITNTTSTNQLKILEEKVKKEREKQIQENKKSLAKIDKGILKLNKKIPSLWNLLWLLIPIGIYAIYGYRFKIRSYLKNIWWV
jgi:hypothetical protein